MTTATETTTTTADEVPKRWPKHAVWVGLAIALSNYPLYYGYIARNSPDLRDIPWLNAPFSWLGLVLATVGTWFVYRQGGGVVRKGLATTGLLLTLFLVGLFNWYVFSFSYTLPESSSAMAVEDAAPDFSLLDDESQQVSLSDYLGKKVVLVFYRGYW